MGKDYQNQLKNLLKKFENEEFDLTGEIEKNSKEIETMDKKIKGLTTGLDKVGDKNLNEKNRIKTELEALTNDRKEKSKYLRRLQGYDAHKVEIKNILDYKKELTEELKELNKEKGYNSKVDKLKKEQIEAHRKLEQLGTERIAIEKELASKDLNPKRRQKLEERKNKISIEQGKLSDKMDSNNITILETEASINKKIDPKALDAKILDVKSKIGKCDLIWTNLLEGRNWEDIGIKMEKMTFTTKNDNSQEINETGKVAPAENKTGEVTPTENKTGEVTPTENKTGEVTPAENKTGEIALTENEKNNLPDKINAFLSRHPWIEKIVKGLKKPVDFVKSKFTITDRTNTMERKETPEKEENVTEPERVNTEAIEQTEEATKPEELKQNTENSRREDFLEELTKWQEIATKGQKEALKAKREQMRQEAANKYAKKFGGRYEQQDGATEKKDEGR